MKSEEPHKARTTPAVIVVVTGAVLLIFAMFPLAAFVAFPVGLVVFGAALLLYVGTGLTGMASDWLYPDREDGGQLVKPSVKNLGIVVLSAVLAALCPEYWGSLETYLGGFLLTLPLCWLASKALP